MAQFLTDATFLPFVRTSPLPVLVDFYKDGCIPCRRIVPLLSKAALSRCSPNSLAGTA